MVYTYRDVLKVEAKVHNEKEISKKELDNCKEYVEIKTEIVKNSDISSSQYDTDMLEKAIKAVEKIEIRHENQCK